MAADKTLEVQLKTNIAEENAKAEKFDGTLKKIVKTNNELNSSKSATRTGSRAADAALGVSEVGMARGTTGAGGRGGERDFARQAQGLGGLVHLYATFAANIYAVSAAFSALQKAADFERMEQSAAKMSVVLGINLNTAAKSMVNLTDGAVSLSEAIEKTNLAASAGLSTKQIMDLTKVAKGASTALGRDMGDSLNRLVKGTVKLEPELLDELGILTKASEAYASYSMGIGKTADELTKFEKTQAFVNAVIAEGNSKFSSLYDTVEANPYTKIEASIQNLGKESLKVINSSIAPLIGFLAESPVGLAAAIGLIVGKLAKMAMPELLAGLSTKVELASASLDKSSANFKRANEAVFKSFESTVGYATISANSKSKILKEATSLRKQLNDSILTDFELSGTGAVQYSAGTTKLITDYETKLNDYKARLAKSPGLITPKVSRDVASIEKELSLLQAMKVSYATLADNEQIAGSARNKENKATLEYLKANRSLRVTELIMDGEHLAALKASYALQVEITREKMKQLGIDKIPGMQKIGGVVGGAIGAAGTALMTFATMLPTITMVVGALAAVYEGIKWLAGEAKSMKDLEAAVDGASDSHKLFGERIVKLSMLMQAGESDTAAYTKAQHLAGTTLNDYADSLTNVYENFRKVKAEIAGGAMWTAGMDWISSLFNKDMATTSAEGMATTIVDAIATATELGNEKVKKALSSALRIDEKDISNIYTVTAKLKELIATGNSYAVFNIQKALQDAGREALSVESRISSVTEALRIANKEAEGVSAKREFKNPKYEELYNTVQMISKVTSESEKTMLFTNLFGGMSDQLKNELGIIDGDLKGFFNSTEFKQYKISQAFDLSEVGANFKKLLSDMKNDAYLFFTDIKNISKSSGTGWMQMGTPSVGTSAVATTEFLGKAQITLDQAEAAKLDVIANLDTMVGDYSKSLGKPLTEDETKLAKEAIKNAATNQVVALASFITEIGNIANTQYANNVDRIRAVSAAQGKLSASGGGDMSAAALFKQATKDLPSAITKLPTKGGVGGAVSYPKDRLRAEKAYVETLKYQLALLEKEQSFNDLAINIAEQRLGLAGEQYGILLQEQYSQSWSIEAQKYINSLAEANLKKEEAILSIKNDKNTLDKDKAIENVTVEYERQKNLIEEGWKFTALKKQDEYFILKLKEAQSKVDLESAKASMMQTKAALARTMGKFGIATEATKAQAAALQDQYNAQVATTATIKEQAGTQYLSSAKYIEALTKQLDLAQKIYDAKRMATEEELKAFELAQGTGGIGQYLTNTAKEFGYQIAEALKSAKSATSVLISGVVSGIDSSIKKLFEGIQQGNLNMQELSDFARNALSDAFRDAAAQSVQNGWKSLLSNVFPSLNDPLKIAIDQNTQAIQANTASQGGSTTGTTSADSALAVAGEKQVDAAKESSNAGKTFLKASDTMFLAGAAMMAFQGKWEQVAFMFLAQLATTLSTMAVTGGSSGGGMWGSLFSAVGGMITGSANGNIMSPYGPLKLNKYANGGIATSPQLSVFGEGDRNEAYVPLPDNRTIPVTLSGNTGGQVSIGDTTINVTVDSSGSAETTIEGNAQMAKMLGQAIKKTVQEEFINQARPGGMLYRR